LALRFHFAAGVDRRDFCSVSAFVVETIGEAWQLAWRITARCAFRNRDGMKSIRPCSYSYDLGLKTVI
jgi:hypothetical protein